MKIQIIDLEGDRALILRLKKAGLEVFNPQGDWNGYGYERIRSHVSIKTVGEKRKYNVIVKALKEEKAKKAPVKDPVQAWAERLARLEDIPIEDALQIAEEKIEYKNEQIYNLNERQTEHYSHKRQVLINSIERSNPLRRIESQEHADAIMAASNRHNNTNYESLLELGRELAATGQIDRGEVRDFALNNINNYGDYIL